VVGSDLVLLGVSCPLRRRPSSPSTAKVTKWATLWPLSLSAAAVWRIKSYIWRISLYPGLGIWSSLRARAAVSQGEYSLNLLASEVAACLHCCRWLVQDSGTMLVLSGRRWLQEGSRRLLLALGLKCNSSITSNKQTFYHP
jgi:hypothetical protein